MPAQRTPLVLVSNRGPVTFDAGGEVQRGSGGLVTALTGLASHRDAIWIASAMNEYDAEVSREHGGRAFAGALARRRRVPGAPRRSATRRPTTASTTCSPTRCCGSSSTTCGTSPTRRTSAARRSRRSSSATTSSTRTSRGRSSRRSRATSEPVVMVHDYHLYTLPDLVRRAAPGRLPAPLHPHPLDAAGRLARAADAHPRGDLHRACWRTTSSASTRAPTGATSCSAAAT